MSSTNIPPNTRSLVGEKLQGSQEFPWLPTNTIFLTLAGSRAYGTNNPNSDTDVRGIAIPPKRYFQGFLDTFEQAEFKGDPDMVVFNVVKFTKLAADCNPNIIEILFTDESDWLYHDPATFGLLHENRNLFLSKKAKHTFSGYAFDQLEKINRHYKWLRDPPKVSPTRAEFGLHPKPLLPKEQLAAAQARFKEKIQSWDVDWQKVDRADRILMQERLATMLAELGYTRDTASLDGVGVLLGFDTNFIQYLQLEKRFKEKTDNWNSYLDWQKNRNPERAVLEAKFGYDVKHAMHLERLQTMACEIQETGKVLVKRPDADKLQAIRRGAFTYEEIMANAKEKQEKINDLYLSCNILPREPDYQKINDLCVEIVERSFKWKQPWKV